MQTRSQHGIKRRALLKRLGLIGVTTVCYSAFPLIRQSAATRSIGHIH